MSKAPERIEADTEPEIDLGAAVTHQHTEPETAYQFKDEVDAVADL